ncbi:frr protein [Lactobacillus selangorensis]|uniref:Ribosome-recycling factor n=1 Tax=Lactobacillus selangorensis TaxID=81857 RepID=A0A0R2FWF9_9LACO|nr:ribosome recycling factor [Lactobacillus selangorensis]KRN29612.1 frr protein [Lactobacillus selangorensis]KRN33858.1 frr protein [Lactobacillus selangorensis]
MTQNPTLQKASENMQKTEQALEYTLGGTRAGRANASLLDRINVDYYGAPTPLNQIAAIRIPEPRVLTVTPYDKSATDNIVRAIEESDIGINPANDGDVIRLAVPQLTKERRQELAKQVSQEAENSKVAIRNIRRDALDVLKKQQKNSDISEDELHDLEDEAQKLTNEATKKIDQIAKDKEKEITEG